MATAREEFVSVSVSNIILELSEDEANTLITILGFVGGSTVRSPRKHSESMSEALRKATGRTYSMTTEYDLLDDRRGITFNDY